MRKSNNGKKISFRKFASLDIFRLNATGCARTLRSFLIGGCLYAAASSSVFAQTTYYWDTLPGTATAGNDVRDGGTGTWNDTTANFTTSSTDSSAVNHNLWPTTVPPASNTFQNSVVFGGATGGTVTVGTFTQNTIGTTTGANVAVRNLTFEQTGDLSSYTLTGGTLRLLNPAASTPGSITVNSGVTATINSAIQGTASGGISASSTTAGNVSTIVLINGGGTLRLGGGNGSLGFNIDGNTTVEMTGGQNSFSGFNLTTVNTGSLLRATNINQIPDPASLNGNGTFDLNGFSQITSTVGGSTNGLNGLSVTNLTSTNSAVLNLTLTNQTGNHTGVISNGTGKISVATIGTLAQGNNFSSSLAFSNQTFAGANTYTGSTTFGRGTVILNFADAAAPTNNILYNGGFVGNNAAADDGSLNFSRPTYAIGAVNAASGTLTTLTLTGKANTANSQAFNGVNFLANSGSSILINPNATANTVALNLGATMTRQEGSVVNFSTTNQTTALSASASILSGAGTAGSLWTDTDGVAFATIGGTDWAAKSADNLSVVAASSLAGFYTAATTNSFVTNSNVTLAGSAATDTRLNTDTTISSLRYGAQTRASLNLNGATLTTGGIMVSSASNSSGNYIGNGQLTSPGLDATLITYAGNSRWFGQGAVVVDGNAGPTGFTKGGSGTAVLLADNTNTGEIVVQQGMLIVTGDNINSGVSIQGSQTNLMGSHVPSLSTTGSYLQLGNSNALGSVGFGEINVGIGGVFAVKRTDAVTIDNDILGLGGFTQTGSGTTTLYSAATAKYTYAGDTTVAAGTLNLDYSASNTGIISDSSRLVLGGGRVLYSTAAGTTHNEVVRDTILIAGASTIDKTGAGAGRLRLNAINSAAAGSSLNFAAAGIADTDSTNTNGIMLTGGVARHTVAGANWAFNSTNGGDGIVNGLVSYGALSAAGANDTLNSLVTNAPAAITASRQTQSLKLDNTSGSVQALTIGSGLTLSLSSGGLLTTGTDAQEINGGIIRSTSATNNSDFVFHQYNSGGLVVNSVVGNGVGGASTITKTGSGDLNLTAANTYTGVTYINGGAIVVGSNANLGTLASGTVNVITSNTGSTSVTLDSATLPANFGVGSTLLGQTVNSISGATVTLSGNANTTIAASTSSAFGTGQGLVFNGGTLRATASFGLSDTIGGTRDRGVTLNGTGGTFDVAPGATLGIVANVTGAGGLTKTGDGNLRITASNYSGNTSILAGTLSLAGGQFNPYSAYDIATNATYDSNGFSNTIGSLAGAAGSIVTNTGVAGMTLTVGSNHSSTVFAGQLSNAGGGALALDKFGAGTLTLTGATNNNTGNTTITGGTLALTGSGALSVDSALSIASAVGTFDISGISGSTTAIRSLAGVADSSVVLGSKNLNIVGTNSTTYSGVIRGLGGIDINKVNATQTFAGPNTYDGVTNINVGILAATNNNALGSTVGNTVINYTASSTTGGRLDVSNNITLAENIVIQGTGDGTPFGRAISGGTGTNTINGNITLTGTVGYRIGASGTSNVLNLGLIQRSTASGGTLTLDPGAGATVNVATAIDNNGGSLTAHGGGLVVLSAANNDVGQVTVQNSTTLRSDVSNTLSSALGNLQIGNAVVNTSTGVGNDVGTFIFNGLTETINALNGAANGGSNASGSGSRLITSTTVDAKTLTIGFNNASGSFDGVIENGSGTTAITKVGTGTQTFQGASTYSGDTIISGGRLLANNTSGSATGTSNLTVNTNGTFGGTGAITGDVVLVGGTLSPGASIEDLTVGSVSGTGSLLIEYDGLASTAIDILNVSGNFDVSGISVNFQSLGGPLAGPSYVFATYGSLTGGVFASVLSSPAGYTVDYAFGGNNIALVQAVPEPSTIAMLGFAGLAAGWYRRKKRMARS